MGYTHHWELKGTIPQDEWDSFIKDCKKLYKNMPKHSTSSGGYYKDDPLYLNGCFKYKYPKFDKNKVLFNGSSIPSKDRKKVYDEQDKKHYWECDPNNLDHETFVILIKAGERWQFCKTARKPYDLMVQAVLLLAKHHFGDRIKIPPEDGWGESDGSKDWKQAIELVTTVLNGEIHPWLMNCLVT